MRCWKAVARTAPTSTRCQKWGLVYTKRNLLCFANFCTASASGIRRRWATPLVSDRCAHGACRNAWRSLSLTAFTRSPLLEEEEEANAPAMPLDVLARGNREALRVIEEDLAALRNNTLLPYDRSFHFLPTADYNNPMVMLLGNHSSGKSTFINHLLGRDVQQTGVAPTDDGFTVIQRGTADADDDGPTSVSDPRYQLQELQKFGIHFVHRFKFKTRRLPKTSRVPPGLMIVDTPGMIDTPTHVRDRTSLEGQLRGYDFLAATRWFAQRCDVILLMFDPANPGTTGETLDVLTKSLAGFEHKFLLVLNKVDMFDKSTDFARAYGALCWNLSKVLQMKDLPRIYTTFIPVETASVEPTSKESSQHQPSGSNQTKSRTGVQAHLPMSEFVRQREEVVEELLRAPLRRLDNLITETEEGSRRILLAGRVCNALVWEFRQRQLVSVLAPTILFSCAALTVSLGGFSGTIIGIAGLFTLGAGGAFYASFGLLRKLERDMLEHSDGLVDRLFIGREKTLDLQLRWKNAVKPEILGLAESSLAANSTVFASLPTLSAWGRKNISSILKHDIPKLRLRVAEYKKKYHSKLGKPPITSRSQ